MSGHSEEAMRQIPDNPDVRNLQVQANDPVKSGQAPARPAPAATRTAIDRLRWAAVLGLVYSAWSGLLYSYVPYEFGVHAGPVFLFVAAGAKIAPRRRLATALILAGVLVGHSCWAHLLANQPSGVSSYETMIAALQQIALQGLPSGGPVRHFLLETLGAVLGVVYVFWSERAQGPVASVPSAPPPRR